MDLVSKSTVWLIFMKVLASRMILSGGVLRKYVDFLLTKSGITA